MFVGNSALAVKPVMPHLPQVENNERLPSHFWGADQIDNSVFSLLLNCLGTFVILRKEDVWLTVLSTSSRYIV